MKRIADGVYPVMVTPFSDDGGIDYNAVDSIVEYYAANGCDGIFAVCQSSEMFFLSEDERAALAERVVKDSAGRLCIVASGHVSDGIDDQIRELSRIHSSGADAVVMVSNRLAAADEDDEVLLANMKKILVAIPDATFGMYECPYPYKRLLSDKVLSFMSECGRFSFIKDTCCDAELIAHRLSLIGGRLQLFNANTATLLETLRSGASGFSGVMANLHPEIYVWLVKNWREQPEKAETVSAFLSLASGTVEQGLYPTSAKYHMQRLGLPLRLNCRTQDSSLMTDRHRRDIDDLLLLEKHIRDRLI